MSNIVFAMRVKLAVPTHLRLLFCALKRHNKMIFKIVSVCSLVGG